jgi:riboflavin kinase / FMN adenylyltransferase
MKVVRSLADLSRDRSSVVTVGTFDGVHLAHQEIIREVVRRARVNEGRSVVVTFDPHPKLVLGKSGQPAGLLCTVEERITLMRELQVDVLLVVPFTREFSRMEPKRFYEEFLVGGVGVSEVVVGYDHMFGRDRGAGIAELLQMGKAMHFSVFAVQPFMLGGDTVSSSLIRRLLAAGDVERARQMLGRPYTLRGRVTKGDGRGRTIGVPTANLAETGEAKIVPGNGVYVVGVRHPGGESAGMMNIGVRPTVTAGTTRVLEVHLLDFAGDLYGADLEVHFHRRLRNERRFDSLDDLKAQLARDRADTLRLVAEHHQRS